MSGACQHDWHFVQGLTARLRCTRCGQMTWPKDAEQKVQEVLRDVHSCSYYCDRPECVKAQRDELRDRLMRPEQELVIDCPRCGHCCPRSKSEQEPVKESSATHSHLWIGDLYGKEKNT